MRQRAANWTGVAAGLVAVLAAVGADAPTAPASNTASPKVPDDAFTKTVVPFTQKYCYECHGDGAHKANVALDKYQSVADVMKDPKTWETVLDKVHRHEMPPDDADAQPTEQERDTISDWIDKQVHQYDPTNPDPGRITLHRLNRAEYSNTIRDLTGVNFHADEDFPPDDSGYGFDNNGDVLSLPPMLMEKYLAAADKILDQAIPTDPIVRRTYTFPAALQETGFNDLGADAAGWVHLISLEEGQVKITVPVPAPGEYKVSMEAYGEPVGGYSEKGVGYRPPDMSVTTVPEAPHIALRQDDTTLHEFVVDATDRQKPGTYSWEVGLPAGEANLQMIMARIRGGANESVYLNGRPGRQQNGLGWIKTLSVEGPLPGAVTRFPAAQLKSSLKNTLTPEGERELTEAGEVLVNFNVATAGDYILRVTASAGTAGDELAKMDLRLDGKSLKTFDVDGHVRRVLPPGTRVFSGHPSALALLHPVPMVYEFRTTLTPGDKILSAAFLNPFVDPNNDDPNLRQRSLVIQNIEVVDLTKPFFQPTMTEILRAYFNQPITPDNKTTRAREVIAQFARRAWRRPVEADELDRLMNLYALADKNGESFEGSVKLAMKAVLVSTHFLFRDGVPAATAIAGDQPAAKPVKIALAKTPAAPAPTQPLGVPVDEFTLATRLSYFLWSSTPDDELLNLAEKNQLRTHLTEQVQRMLASPKARALVDNFAGQWLQFRSLDTFEPDATQFANFSPTIRSEMRTETEKFFEHIQRQDCSILDFLTADYTFVNEDLATYYGLPGVTGEDFRQVSLKDTQRRGVLTQGSVLVLTSNPTRTSPVKRGKWVLENLLGTPPPPPPPNVPVLDEETQLTGTLRQQMEQHRANPTCASCHARMDPIGFGLENFDAAGQWRDKDGTGDNPPAIDSSGTLLTGESFHGAAELVKILADKKRTDFQRCLSEKMLTYALGRGLEFYDRAATDKIIASLDQGGNKFSTLILGVVNSIPFQEMRRTEPAPATSPDKPADKLAGP